MAPKTIDDELLNRTLRTQEGAATIAATAYATRKVDGGTVTTSTTEDPY